MAGTQRKSILQSYVESNGAEGLNKDYVSQTTGQNYTGGLGTEGSSAGGTQRKTILQSYMERNSTTASNANKWFSDAYSLIGSMSSYTDSNKDIFNRDYGADFTSQIEELLSSAAGVQTYLYSHQREFENYDELVDAMGQYRDALKQYNTQNKAIRDYYSQWEDEDQYNWHMTYQGKSSGELAEVLGNLEADSKEYEWVSGYAAYQDQQEKLAFDTVAARQELDALTARYEEAKALKGEYDRYVSGAMRDPAKASAALRGLQKYGGVEGLNALEKEITERTMYLNQAQRLQDNDKRTSEAVNAEDFKDFSKYSTTINADAKWWQAETSDELYEWINDKDGFRDKYEESRASSAAFTASTSQGYALPADATSRYTDLGYDKLTEDEIAIFNYYYAKEGKEAAQQYLDGIQETLNYRKAEEIYKPMEDRTALELVFGVRAGLDQFGSGLQALFSDEDYIPPSAIQMASQMVRGDLEDNGAKLPDWLGGASVGQAVYDATTTTANMLPSILASTASNFIAPGSGVVVGGTLMGASAAGSAYQEMLNLGYDKGQAKAYGALVGASEAGLQVLLGGISKLSGGLPQKGVEALLKNVDNAFARAAISIGTNMISEGTEEYLQEVLTPWFQNLVLNTENEVKLFTPEALYSGLLGALTAGVMEGPTTIAGEVKTYSTGKEFQQMEGGVNRLTQLGKTFSADSVAHQLAGRVNENTGAYTIGRLFNEIGATLTEQNQSEIMLSLERKGIDHDSAKTISSTLAAVVDGSRTLTAKQAAIWNANKDISKTIMDVIINPNSTVSQRSLNYNKALMDLAKSKAGESISSAAEASAGGTKEAAVGKTTSDIAAPTERTLEASEDGKTTLKDSGKEVNIKSIASIKDGAMTLELEDGTKVDSKEVLYASDGEALVYETVAGMNINAAAATALVQKYNPTMNAEVYSRGIQEAYRYGMYNIPVNEMLERGAFSKDLNEEQRNTAYSLGRIFKEGKVDAQTKAVSKAYEKAKEALKDGGKKRKPGKVKFHDHIDERTFTPQQKVVLDEARVLSAALGIDIHFYSGMKEYGRYVKGTGSIWLNVNANISGQTLMQNTLSHELVHFASEWSPDKFKAFADFLIAHYGKEGMSVEQAILAKQREYAEDGIELTEDEAYEELIAEAASTMLTDSNAVETLAKLNPDIVQKIKGFFQDLLKRIQEYFGQLPADSPEAQRVREMEQETQKILQNLFTEMLVDAGEHYSTIRQAFGKNTAIETNADGEFLLAKNDGKGNKKTDILFNAATWERGGRDTLETALRNEGFSAADVKAALTIMDAKYELVKQLGEEYSEQDRINQIDITTDIKDGHSVISALVTNGDYPVNIDLMMVCKKRQAYQKVINRLCETGLIQKATIDSLAIAEINKILGKYGFETACLGCFVESRRLRIQEWAETIVKEWNAEVKKRNPNAKAFAFGKSETKLTQAEIMQLVGELESGGEKNDKGNLNLGQGSAVKRMGVLLDKVPSLQRTLSVEDLITPDGLKRLRQFDSNLFSMVKSRYGSNSPKYVQDFNPYNSELAIYGKVPSQYKSLREYLYAIGGARMQSFSDFIVENWFDYAQIVADLAARKLPMHTYTKEIALVKLFGMTGIKVNMSLIPDVDHSLGEEYAGLTLNENGEYELIWADKDRHKATGGKSFMQSINFADAIALQEDPRYSANVGTIAVGISDNHILKMLDDPRIRMIIPYHSSGMNPIYAHIVGSSYYKDYTNSQNTTVAYLMDSKGNRKSLKLTKPQIGKLTAGFEFNQKLQELGDARATAEAYKEWCKDASQHTITINGETYTAVLTPKFNDFADHNNYYKLLEDFNTYDCITEEAAPQGDVTQTYPEDFEDLLKAEVQAREEYRQKQDPKFNDAMAEIEDFLETHSKANTVHYADKQGIKLGAKDKKLNASEKAKLTELKAKEKTMYRMPSGAANSQFSKAIEAFGTTTDFNEAGFILPGGEMLKFTDDKHRGERQYDHRAIGMAYGVDVDLNVNRGYNKDSNKHLDDFVENGGIRFDPGSLEFNFDAMMQMSKNVPITKEQERAIRDFIRWKKEREAQYNPDDDPLSLYRGPLALRIDFGGTSAVAISADRGELGIKTLTYEGGQINADRIIADIRHYYQTGEVRQPSLTAQFRYRMPPNANKQIMRGMTDEERYEVLKDKKIALHAKVDMGALKAAEDKIGQTSENLGDLNETSRKKLLRTIGREFGIFKQYTSSEFKLTFHFGTRNLKHSADKQKKNYHDFAKMLTCFDDIINSAVGIEVHNRNEEGYKKDESLKNVYVLISAFEDADRIIPVKLEVKEFWDKENTLYVAISLEGIKKDEVVTQEVAKNDVAPSARSSEIMIADLFAKINPSDTSFLKYVPKQFLETDSVGEADTMRGNGAVMTEERIDYLIADSGAGSRTDYAQKWITSINPTDFLNMTLGRANQDRAKFDTMPGDYDSTVNDYDFIEGGLKKSRQTPYLAIDIETGEVVGHEGRHRMRALEKAGVTYAEIAIEFRDGDGRIIKQLNGYGNPLEVIDSLTIYNQRGTGQSSVVRNIIPLNKANRDAVLQQYGAAREGDISYRQGSGDSLNTRHLLANALETVAQNDIERNKIQEYKGKIDLVNAEERKLQDLRAEIKELSFAKGPKDTAKIKSLQFEAIQAANRINTIDRQLLRLEASKPLQAVLEREKAMATKRAEQKGKEALEAYREKAAKTQRELLERVQQSRKNAKEGRDRTAMRHKIKDIVNELNTYLLKGTKDKHVMIGLQKAVAAALDAVNMDTVGAEERIAKLNEELIKAKTPEKIMEITRRIERVQAMGDKMSDRLAKLKAAYADIKDSDDPLIANSHDEVIERKIEYVMKLAGETPLRNMSLEQLEEVYELYKMVLTRVRDSNKAFKDAKKRSIDMLASNTQMEVEDVGGRKKHPKIFDGVSRFLWNNFKPIYAFKAIGSKTLGGLFDNVRAGEDVWAKDVSEARIFFLEQSKKHGYDSWDMKKTYTFTSITGMDFKLNLEQIMSLYAYSKRKQAEDHLQYGGIVFEDSFEKKKLFGKFEINLKTEDATAYNISPETMNEIIAILESVPGAKTFVDAMQDYLSATMGEKGNEVSLEMYGVKLFKEKFYFPLKSSTAYMARAREQAQGEVKIKNSGFTKETNPHAKNPIVLESFLDVWANHVNDMSMYHAFTLPLEDFYRVFNYKTPNTDPKLPAEGVIPAIQNAYGKAATGYIDQMLRDLNGGARSDPTAGFINKMMGLFKKGAVFASASVVIQQPSAIARAMALVDSKYFAGKKLDSKRHAVLWEEVKQYAPVAVIKEMGYFDTNVGKSTVDFIKAKEYDSWGDKMKGLVTDGGYRDEVLSKAPALADELAWCAIWEAVKRETAAKHKGLTVGSEAFLKAAGERFTEVIVNTQVYDSVLSRSANMRSKDTGMKMATAFLAEPTTSINMIADALIQGKRGNRKYARAAIGSVIASQILNAILVSFVYAGRDDDEDETYWEKYLGSLVAEVKDSFNLFGYIPFVKDIVSIVQGYDVERSDIAVISDLWKAYEQLGSDKLSAWRKVENFAGSIAQLFGLPVKNIMRDVRGLYQTVESFMSGNRTTSAGVGYAIKGALTGKDVSDRQQLYEAIMAGDTAHAERVKARFEDQAAIDSAIRKALRENDPRIHEAAVARYGGDIAEYTRIAKEIIAEGHFSQDYVVTAINTEMNTLKPESEGSSGSKTVGLYTDDDYFAAIVAGDTAAANIVKEGLIAADVAKGDLESTAQDSLESSFVTNVKGSYLEGNLTAANVRTLLTKYGDMDADKADTKLAEWDFEAKYGYSWSNRDNAYRLGVVSQEQLIQATMKVKDVDRETATNDVRFLDFQLKYPQYSELTSEQYKGYYAAVDTLDISPADAQIDVGTYAEYRIKRTSFKGVDEDGDGKTDSGSVKVEVLAYIDSLPLTSQQKDVLYFMNGWSARTIDEAPWH